MNATIILIICEFATLAIIVVVLFARLSYHYAKMYQASPDAARDFQERFSKSPAAEAQPGARPEISYRPLEQLGYLAEIRPKYAADPQASRAIDRVAWDLRLTMAWLAACGLLGLSTVIALLY